MLNRLISKKTHRKATPDVSLAALERENFLFIHIPKTAGTSFRAAIEKNCLCICDYGANSNDTSSLVTRYIYPKDDYFDFKSNIGKLSHSWICGHIPIYKYLDCVKIQNTFSFVREPVAQIVSHYNHSVKHNGFKGSFDDFLEMKVSHNIQSRTLAYLPIPLIGLVGVTERYQESLEIISHQLNMDIQCLERNKNEQPLLDVESVTSEQIARIKSKNQEDLHLYESACFLLEKRREAAKNSREWIYADIRINQDSAVIAGCAYYQNSEQAVGLEIYKNGAPYRSLISNSYYPHYCRANLPRDRYVGFNVRLKSDTTPGDKFDVFDALTGRKLHRESLVL